MDEVKDFCAKTVARQTAAVKAWFSGNPEPYIEMLSTRDSVSMFGAWGACKSGFNELSRTIRWAASRLSHCSDLRFDVEVADIRGELAYTVGYERFNTSVDGGPVTPKIIRVTHIYRRETGEWKIVHRHGD
jgi:hypothetical protein